MEARARRSLLVLLALVAYVPALLTAPGVVATDTKQYLYLDPGRLLGGASRLWDPQQFGGWVTHQNIGYLWPMGPFFWAASHFGVPVWVAQRLWLGTLLFAAGTGVRFLARQFGLHWNGAIVAALLYQLSPYAVAYASRTSVLLAPWAGLGWMVAFTVRAARRGGWRDAALFALVVLTVGGINATALVLCGLGPVLWLVHAAARREISVRRAIDTAARLATLSVVVSLWWIVALAMEARYGADVLSYSETLPAVSSTASAAEVLRGLGYWLFYGGDVTGRWNSASTPYLQSPGLIAVGFVLVTACIVAAVLVRWRERAFAVTLVAVGLVVAVSAHPFTSPSPLGRLLRSHSRSSLVLALRSATRATPLVLLGAALAAGALVTALPSRPRRLARAAMAGFAVLAVLQLPSLWTGTYVDAVLRRPSQVPAAWRTAATDLGRAGSTTRVLELPGQEFAAYRWGETNDAILPGLTTRPTLTRDLLPLGGAGTMNLLLALDDRFQTGTVDPASVAPVARRLGVGDVVVRGDAAYERYGTPRPGEALATLAGAAGLGAARSYGDASVNRPAVAVVDGIDLSSAAASGAVAPVVRFPVTDVTPIVRAEPAAATTVVSGDGEGVVDLGARLTGAFVYSASTTDPAALRQAVAPGAPLVVTDSNRKRAREWRGSQDTTGYTEAATDGVLRADPADARLPLFPGATSAAYTLGQQRGALRATATAYGEPNSYRPEDRAAMAIDGDPATAWLVGDRGPVLGERLHVDLAVPQPVTTVDLAQPARTANRWITRVRIRTDAGTADVDLGVDSRHAPGQRIALPVGTSRYVDVEILATDADGRPSAFGLDAVGFAEVGLAGLHGDEVVRPPVDLLAALGADTASHPLTYSLRRERVDQRDRWRQDPEPAMVRAITVPTSRQFDVQGVARISSSASDAVLHALAGGTGAWAEANSRLAGVLAARADAAVDGDPATAWTSAFGTTVGASITVHLPASTTLSHLDLRVLADGRHSVPTELSITAGGQQRTVALPATVDGGSGTVASVPVDFVPLTGDALTVTVTRSRDEVTLDRRTGERVTLPVAFAELGLAGGMVGAAPAARLGFPTGCRSDLLSLDGAPLPVALTPAADGTASLTSCAGAALALTAGEHVLRAAKGRDTGIDLDQLVLTSPAPAATTTPTSPGAPAPVARVVSQHATTATVEVTASAPVWLVDGQSRNPGWHATVAGRDLGPSRMLDGYANGWLIAADPAGRPVTVHLEWTPQHSVDVALAVSALGVLACAALALTRGRRRSAVVPTVFTLASPWAPGPSRAPMTDAVAAAVLGGLVAGVAIDPRYGIGLAAVVLVAARWPRHRRLVALGAPVTAGAVGLFYLARQVRSRPAAGFGWIQAFEPAHRVALLAVALLVADVWLTRAPRHREQDEGGGVDGGGRAEALGRDGLGDGPPA